MTGPTGSDAEFQREAEFAFHPGEHPAWKIVGDLRRQKAPAVSPPVGAAYTPLASLLYAASLDTLNEVRLRAATLDRAALVQRYRAAFADGKRLVAFIMAGQLIERGIPPCFWHEVLALDGTTATQRADLLLADLAWLRRWHSDHASAVRYQRGKALLTGSDAVFHRETEFAFHQGKRPAWKVVGSLSPTERQQWDADRCRLPPVCSDQEAGGDHK